MSTPNVRPGQIWADNDKRVAGRTLRIERVDGDRVLCRILTNDNGTQQELDRRDGKRAVVHDRRGKTTSVALRRFVPTSTGYRLVEDAA